MHIYISKRRSCWKGIEHGNGCAANVFVIVQYAILLANDKVQQTIPVYIDDLWCTYVTDVDVHVIGSRESEGAAVVCEIIQHAIESAKDHVFVAITIQVAESRNQWT